MELVLQTTDGKQILLCEYAFEYKIHRKEVGLITVGGLSDGDKIKYNDKGFTFLYQDGTKYFVSYKWFI